MSSTQWVQHSDTFTCIQCRVDHFISDWIAADPNENWKRKGMLQASHIFHSRRMYALVNWVSTGSDNGLSPEPMLDYCQMTP